MVTSPNKLYPNNRGMFPVASRNTPFLKEPLVYFILQNFTEISEISSLSAITS
jgi:hypothetical protein